MGKKSNQNPALGKALMNKKKIQHSRQANAENNAKEEVSIGLKSVTEETSYDEFIATAALANKDFTAEKLNIKFVSLSTSGDLNATDFTEAEKKLVVVPRRPPWNTQMTPEELDEAEKETFLQWRRSMAHLQEKEGITPFERNMEVWRQLWRVVEKSDIVIQIVDGRNPLMYRCEDLESYVKEMGKKPVLLINKADFLSQSQREYWQNYFEGIGLSHAFYSAAVATAKLKPVKETEDEEGQLEGQSDSEESESEPEEAEDSSKNLPETPELKAAEVSEFAPFGTEVLDRDKLVDFLKTFKADGMKMLQVGLVGYPNVGKSSTINSLMASKKTSVSSTPGKTKHFQTLFLTEEILLCDCPGLVMPAFGGSKGAMVLGGILPIDQLTNYAPAMALLAEQIPRRVLETKYGISLPKDYVFEDIVSSYAYIRGFMTARGLPDSSRAARIILKDYVDGRLVYCHAPPNVHQNQFQPISAHEFEPLRSSADCMNIKPTVRKPNLERLLDNQFFAPQAASAHVKGKVFIATGDNSANSSTSSLIEKPWKKHNNKNKKEKLRRVYRHLDVE